MGNETYTEIFVEMPKGLLRCLAETKVPGELSLMYISYKVNDRVFAVKPRPRGKHVVIEYGEDQLSLASIPLIVLFKLSRRHSENNGESTHLEGTLLDATSELSQRKVKYVAHAETIDDKTTVTYTSYIDTKPN